MGLIGTRPLTIPVVGVSFADNYPDNLLSLADDSHAGIVASLVREPENEYDTNAIAVYVPSIESSIGHIPRDRAMSLAPKMDNGTTYRAQLTIKIDPSHLNQPGAVIDIWTHST